MCVCACIKLFTVIVIFSLHFRVTCVLMNDSSVNLLCICNITSCSSSVLCPFSLILLSIGTGFCKLLWVHIFPFHPSSFLSCLLFTPCHSCRFWGDLALPQQVRAGRLQLSNNIWCILVWKCALAFPSVHKTKMFRWRKLQTEAVFHGCSAA